jgi:type II secretory pathway component PulM
MAESMASLRWPAPLERLMAGRTRSERYVAVSLLGAVIVIVLWFLVWQPLVRDRDTMRAARGGLARGAAVPAAPAPRDGLERVLVQQNLRSTVTQLDWQDGRAHLVFAAIGYDPLIAMLEALQRDAWLRVAEAVITARVEPGTVRAELTLAR